LAALLLLQIIDCKSLLTGVHQMLNSKPAAEVRLKSPFWKHLGSRFKTLVVLPAFQSQFVLRTYDAPGRGGRLADIRASGVKAEDGHQYRLPRWARRRRPRKSAEDLAGPDLFWAV
jgi:hypothetical protein